MGWTIGLPCLKLNKCGVKSKHCGDFGSVAAEALEERKGHDPDINRELSKYNDIIGFRTAEELMRYSDKHCESMYDSTGRGIRKDAVRMCVTVIKPPVAMMKELTPEDQRKLLDDAVEKFEEIVTKHNVKSKAYHVDEEGMHVHLFWEPITKDGRLCAKEMHNLKFFSRLNKEMPEHLRKCGWDIDDCQAYDQAKEALKTEKQKAEERRQRGRSSYSYKADAERKKNELEQDIDVKEQHLVVLESDIAQREDRVRELDRQADEIEEWLDQIPDWDTYNQEASRAWKILDDFKRLLEDVFSSKWIFRNRTAEKTILEAVSGVRDAIMTAISAMRGFEIRESIPDDRQRSKLISKSLDQMMEAAEQVRPKNRIEHDRTSRGRDRNF